MRWSGPNTGSETNDPEARRAVAVECARVPMSAVDFWKMVSGRRRVAEKGRFDFLVFHARRRADATNPLPQDQSWRGVER